MIDDHSIARPYAEAAFDFALAENKSDDWETNLEVLSLAVQDDKVAGLLDNPQVDQQRVIDLLINVVGANDPAIKNFIMLLAEYNRLAVAPAISDLFNELKMAHERLLDAHVYSPYSLIPEQTSKLKSALAKKFNQQVVLHEHVDSSLIGGIIVRIGDIVIDNSIHGKIGRIKAHLNLKETVCQ